MVKKEEVRCHLEMYDHSGFIEAPRTAKGKAFIRQERKKYPKFYGMRIQRIVREDLTIPMYVAVYRRDL